MRKEGEMGGGEEGRGWEEKVMCVLKWE